MKSIILTSLKKFSHGEVQPLEGRGYFVRQEDSFYMLEFINKQIQKHRMPESGAPVHITVSESAAGSLRFGLDRPKTVIGFPDSFEIGPLSRLHEKEGQTLRFQWMKENINTGMDDYEYENKFINTLLKLEDIPEQVPIYLWTANNASEQTGLRFILTLLAGKGNDLFLINSTEAAGRMLPNHDDSPPISYTSQIRGKDLQGIYRLEKTVPLSEDEKLMFQEEWQELSSSGGVLRIWEEGHIVTVSTNHYDSLY